MTERKPPEVPSGEDSTDLAADPSGPPLPPGISRVRAQVRASLFGGGPPVSPFTPGTLVAGRYRISSFLGEGGMGRVYRADDLVLDEEVAIKFLPRLLGVDATYLERFLQEVRVARKVSHPNVCRVHDIAEVDGQYFLTMEFVDGEDLGSLLRRAGPLGPTRALEVASELCAGLTALHECGILHRDLKPANVMVDRRGRVKLADFGLAGFVGEFDAAEIRQGTPAYQAPEQREGQEVSTRSDIYSLGLILYELLHGPTPKLPDGAELHASMRSDGVYGDTVRMCLERDPSHRPTSVAEVASLLGCDDLSLAIAQGKRPSPSTIANARSSRAWSRGQVWLALVVIAVTSIGGMLIERVVQGVKGLHTVPCEELVVRARTFVESVRGADAVVSDALSVEQPSTGYDGSEPPPPVYAEIRHWSYVRLRPVDAEFDQLEPGETVTHWTLDGVLRRYRTAFDPNRSAIAGPIDWQPWLEAARLDVGSVVPIEPVAAPTDGSTVFAWDGTTLDGSSVTIEATAIAGQPLAFEAYRSDRKDDIDLAFAPSLPSFWRGMEQGMAAARSDATPQGITSTSIGALLLLLLFAAIAVMISVLVWQRVRSGAADQRTAQKLAIFVAAALTTADVLSARTLGEAFEDLGANFVVAALSWALYLIVEPFVRVQMPRSLVGWNRLMQRGRSDAVVAAEILVGVATGSAFAMAYGGYQILSSTSSGPAAVTYFTGLRSVLAGMVVGLTGDFLYACAFVTLLAVGQAFTRRWRVLAVTICSAAMGFEAIARASVPWIAIGLVAYLGLTYWILRRFGLLAVIASSFAGSLIPMLPWAQEGSASLPIWIALLGASVWAARILLRGTVEPRRQASAG